MKTLKRILVALLILVGVYMITALLAPDSYEVVRSKTINAPVDVVWDQVSQFNNWENWSPWKEKDPTATYELDGADGTVGTTYKWAGDIELSGEGYMKISEVVEHEKFGYELGFTKPMEMKSDGGFTLKAVGETTEVTWKDGGEIGFLSRPIMMMFMDLDGMIGPDFERGLTKIDSISMVVMENRKANQVKEEMFAGGLYIGKRHLMKISDIDSSVYAESYGALMPFCAENGLNVVGAPGDIMYSWNPQTDSADFSVFLKVDQELDMEDSEFEMIKLEETKALVYDFYGAYNDLGKGHEILMGYLAENGYEMTYAIEEFLNDPTTVNSPEEILTRIYYLLK